MRAVIATSLVLFFVNSAEGLDVSPENRDENLAEVTRTTPIASPALAESDGIERPAAPAFEVAEVWPSRTGAHLPRALGSNPTLYVGGWIAQGFTGNLNHPTNGLNRPVLFNDRANQYLLNQANLFAEMPAAQTALGIGGRLDLVYGYDGQFLTAPGLEKHHDHSSKWNGEDRSYQFAIPQAYLEFTSPIDDAISLKVGRFRALAGYEAYASPGNFFYSHSYSFTYATPFTHTGGLLSYSPNRDSSLFMAITNGWDVWDSRENLWGFQLGFSAMSSNDKQRLSVVWQTGEDIANARLAGRFIDGHRNALHIVVEQHLSSNVRYVLAPVIGTQQSSLAVVDLPATTLNFEDAQWYGVTQYLLCRHGDWISSGVRLEWFRDEDHSRLGVPIEYHPGGPAFRGGNYYALTAGMNLKLSSNLLLRPEFRWDWSDTRGNSDIPSGDGSIRAFGDRTNYDQIMLGFDMVWSI